MLFGAPGLVLLALGGSVAGATIGFYIFLFEFISTFNANTSSNAQSFLLWTIVGSAAVVGALFVAFIPVALFVLTTFGFLLPPIIEFSIGAYILD